MRIDEVVTWLITEDVASVPTAQPATDPFTTFPVPKELFTKEATANSYTPRFQEKPLPIMYVTSKNGVKCEIKRTGGNSWNYIIGWGLLKQKNGKELMDSLKIEVQEKGFTIVPIKTLEYVKLQGIPGDPAAIMNRFWELVKTVENINEINIKIQTRGGMSAIVPPSDFRYFIGLGYQILNAVRSGLPHLLPRGGGEGSSPGSFDVRDSLITTGITPGGREQQKATGKAYREHVVPCDFILRRAVEIAKDRKKPEKERAGEIARLIKRNLAIVLISKEEANLIDNELGWKTTMPPGWQFGDDIYARLTQAGLKIEPLTISEEIGDDF